MHTTKRLIFFASGAGSNVLNILNRLKPYEFIQPELIVTNKKEAGVIEVGKKLGVEVSIFSKQELEGKGLIEKLRDIKPDLIVLAGFLLKMPATLVSLFPNKIINIHPALLPKYGGKGMYGKYVHQAVFENKETETGITIHYVNEAYDEGEIILQKKIKLEDNETPESIERKVRELEMIHFPETVLNLLIKNNEL